MFDRKTINLPKEEKTLFYYRTGKIKTLSKEIRRLVDEFNHKKIDGKRDLLIPEDLRLERDTNAENIEEMKEVIFSSTLSEEDKIRMWNLYLGMRYVLEIPKIVPENLRNLYDIISNNIVNLEDESMGEFYRTTREYVSHFNGIFPDYTEAPSPKNVSKFMEHYFSYIAEEEQSKMDIFLKSQIMHLYFVYVHPYLDGNGRSARLVSTWYLLSKDADEFLLFNKAISNNKDEYKRMVRKSIESKDFTHYLVFILSKVKVEFEKELEIKKLEEEKKISLSQVERQIIEIILSLKEKATLQEIVRAYQNYDPHRKLDKIVLEQLLSMMEKGIIVEQDGFVTLGFQKKEKMNQYGG